MKLEVKKQLSTIDSITSVALMLADISIIGLMTSNGSEEKGKLVFKQRKKEGFYPSFFDSNHKNKIIVPRPTHIETKATKK